MSETNDIIRQFKGQTTSFARKSIDTYYCFNGSKNDRIRPYTIINRFVNLNNVFVDDNIIDNNPESYLFYMPCLIGGDDVSDFWSQSKNNADSDGFIYRSYINTDYFIGVKYGYFGFYKIVNNAVTTLKQQSYRNSGFKNMYYAKLALSFYENSETSEKHINLMFYFHTDYHFSYKEAGWENAVKYEDCWEGMNCGINENDRFLDELTTAIKDTGYKTELDGEGDGEDGKGLDDNNNNKLVPPNYDSVPTDDGSSDGGSGDFNEPSLSAIDSGFITVYNPTSSVLKQFAKKLWSTDFLDSLLKLYNQPIDNIISLHKIPCSVSTEVSSLKIANYDTNIQTNKVNKQYVTIDCGSLLVKPSSPVCYADFSPYTKCDLYLPYVGIVPLDTDKLMCKTLHIKYKIDVITGSFLCNITIIDSDGIEKLFTSYNGNCAEQLCVTGTNYGNIYQSMITSATSICASGANIVTSSLDALTEKPSFPQSNSITSVVGNFGSRYPFILFQRPYKITGSIQSKLGGYANNTTSQIKNLQGFFKCENFYSDFKNDYANPTNEEIEEINNKLHEGVYIDGM